MKKEKTPQKGRRGAGKKSDAHNSEAENNENNEGSAKKSADPSIPMPAHLYVGPRDVKVKLGEDGLLRVMSDLQDLRKDIANEKEHLVSKQQQINDIEEKRTRLKAEYREIEDLVKEAEDRILEIIDANTNGYRLERVEVDEVFMQGEIITYRKGTKEEIGEKRNALPAEWEAAKSVKADGKPVERWQKSLGPATRKGFVVIDGGKDGQKEVRASGDGTYGYIGPEDDPRKPQKEKEGGKKAKGAKQKEPKVMPHSLKGDAPLLHPLDPPKVKNTFALRLIDGSSNEIGAMKVVRHILEMGPAQAKKLVTGPMPAEVTRDLTEENAQIMVKMFSDVGVSAEYFDTAAKEEPKPTAPPAEASPADPPPSA